VVLSEERAQASGPQCVALCGVMMSRLGSEAHTATVDILGLFGTRSFVMAETEAMDLVEGYGGFTCPPHPRIVGPTWYKGIALTDLLDTVGGLSSSSVVSVASTDGYVMTFSSEQLMGGGLTTYDPETGAQNAVERPPRAVLVCTVDGSPASDKDGLPRLVFLSPSKNQVVEGFLWVRRVARIHVRTRYEEWRVLLRGAARRTLDRTLFKALAADPEYREAWQDMQGRTWTGVPFYKVAGLVEGEPEEQTCRSKRGLGEIDYTVTVVGTDGMTVSLNSTEISESRGIIVAGQMEGNPLGDVEFPLRLVGPALRPSQMVGGIREIHLLSSRQ
jgi:hypothetical protein